MTRQTAVPLLAPHRRRFTALARIALAALLLAALGLSVAQPAAAQTSYTVTDLGRLPTTDRSYPNNVDATDTANVKVVGTTVIGGTGIGSYAYRGFYWSSATNKMVSIGVIGAGSDSRANDVNSRGEVVGDSSTVSGGGNNHALYWNPGRGEGNPLDLTRDAWPLSQAYNINENGIIVGTVWTESTGDLPACWIPTSPNSGVYNPTVLLPRPSNGGTGSVSKGRYLGENGDIVGKVVDADGVEHAAYWKNTGTSESPVYGLPTVIIEPSAGAGVASSALIINSKSQIVGGWGSPGRPFGWNPGDAVATDLGVFSSNTTSAWGLNDSGQVALLAPITVGSSYEYRAALWLPQNDLAIGTYSLTAGLNLLTTPGGAGTLGGTQTRPHGLSYNGRGFTLNINSQVVGFSTTSTGEYHAFIWDKANKMRDLNSKTLTPNKATFAYLRDAAGITDNGYVVGTGQTLTSKGKTYINTYLLTPTYK